MSDTFDITLTEGGAIKGKNATIKSIEPIEGGNRVTFEWEENDGTKLTNSMDVMDGEKGDTGETPDISMSATVNQTIGTPHVAVSKTGTKENPHFDVAFSGIKGEKGDIGITPDIDMTATVNQTIGTPSVEVSKNGTAENPSFNLAIKNVKGEKGDTGATPNISATASVGNTVGTPSVSVSRSGSNENPKLNFAFNNLKGNTGATPNISASATVNQTIGNPTVSVERSGTNENPSLAFSFSGLKGEKGDDGLDGFSARLPQAEYNPNDYLVVDNGTDAKKISVGELRPITESNDYYKNLQLYGLDAPEKDGITVVDNHDGTFTVNGTATKNVYVNLIKSKTPNINRYMPYGKYKLSGCPSGGSNNTYNLTQTFYDSNGENPVYNQDNGVGIETSLVRGKETMSLNFIIANGVTVTNLTIAPKLELLELEDGTLTNQVLTKKLEANGANIDDIWKTQSELGAKNLLVYPYESGESRTNNGITFTVNNDGSVVLNGTSTAWTSFYLERERTLKAGEYIISSNNLPKNVYVSFKDITNNKNYNCTADEQAKKIAFNEDSLYSVFFQTQPNVTLDNFVIYPMLRHASDPDGTWVPYAKTNQELTEDVTALGNKTSLPIPYVNKDANIPYADGTFNVERFHYQSANIPPINSTSEIVTFQRDENNSTQFAFAGSVPYAYIRKKISGVWGNWKRLVNEDDLANKKPTYTNLISMNNLSTDFTEYQLSKPYDTFDAFLIQIKYYGEIQNSMLVTYADFVAPASITPIVNNIKYRITKGSDVNHAKLRADTQVDSTMYINIIGIKY